MEDRRWLLLLHQIPPKPAYFRAKILRRLIQVGALPVKNSAYLLPDREDTLEDFEWICQEIKDQGGAAWLFRAETLAGMSSSQIEAAFQELRAPDYAELITLARHLVQEASAGESSAARQRLAQLYERVKQIDFFECPARKELAGLMAEIDARDRPVIGSGSGAAESGRTWVTRKGIKVDRIGSAWLIQRFIDPRAEFRFVSPGSYQHKEGEIRFDMLGAEFTHEGDQCTFEVLVSRSDLLKEYPALRAVAELVHDIDLKDARYQRPETAGLARMIEGLCARLPDDDARLAQGQLIFASLYESFTGS